MRFEGKPLRAARKFPVWPSPAQFEGAFSFPGIGFGLLRKLSFR